MSAHGSSDGLLTRVEKGVQERDLEVADKAKGEKRKEKR
jgi:hypothetical protein